MKSKIYHFIKIVERDEINTLSTQIHDPWHTNTWPLTNKYMTPNRQIHDRSFYWLDTPNTQIHHRSIFRLDTPNTQIHDRSFYWLDTPNTQIHHRSFSGLIPLTHNINLSCVKLYQRKNMFLVGVYGITFTAIWYYVTVKQVVITTVTCL
jgi:hypothetical protein